MPSFGDSLRLLGPHFPSLTSMGLDHSAKAPPTVRLHDPEIQCRLWKQDRLPGEDRICT